MCALGPRSTLLITFGVSISDRSLFSSYTMGRKRSAAFAFDNRLPSSDDEQPNLPGINIRDTYIEVFPNGGSSRRIRHIHNPASPQKRASVPQEPTWLQDGPLPEISLEDYPFLDPAYLDFLDDGMDTHKRNRTASVSPFSDASGIFFKPHLRTIP